MLPGATPCLRVSKTNEEELWLDHEFRQKCPCSLSNLREAHDPILGPLGGIAIDVLSSFIQAEEKKYVFFPKWPIINYVFCFISSFAT